MLETRPASSFAIRRGIIESLKTMENSAATVARQKKKSTSTRLDPGAAYHSIVRQVILIAAKTMIHGFLRPVWSAIEPSTGERIAMTRPAAATPQPQAARPMVESPAMRDTKYGPKMKVVTTVLGGGLASRFFSELRDKQGLAYTTAAREPLRVTPGYFLALLGTAPANQEKAEAALPRDGVGGGGPV